MDAIDPSLLAGGGVADLLVMTTKKKPCNTRYEQPVTDARLYSKQPKCVFERDWIDVYFKLLDAHFPGIPFAKNPGSKPATETVEVEFPRDFPRAPLSGKAIGYVACRAVFRDLVSEYLYAWKDDQVPSAAIQGSLARTRNVRGAKRVDSE